MEISINAEDIDRYVKESLINSSIGSHLKEMIDTTIKEVICKSYNNPFKEVILNHINDVVKMYLEDHKVEVYTAIAQYLTPETISNIINFGTQKLKDDMERYN